MKIVVLDGYTENPGDLTWEPLAALGDLEVHDRSRQEDVAEVIGDAEIAIVNKLDITKEIIDACPNLRYIGVLATGYDCVDYRYAREKGIPVTNIPVYGTNSVAQFAISLLLEICEHVGHHDQAVHEGRWDNNQDWCFWEYPLIELAGKTMGIIGFGRIGQTTGQADGQTVREVRQKVEQAFSLGANCVLLPKGVADILPAAAEWADVTELSEYYLLQKRS